MGNDYIEELNEVISDEERAQRERLKKELTEMVTPRYPHLAPKACGCSPRVLCRCIQPKPQPTGDSGLYAMFECAVMNDRRFWENFCQTNNTPLGHLAGIRAMGLVKQVEDLAKELQLANDVIEALKKEKIEIGQKTMSALNAMVETAKVASSDVKGLVLNSHKGVKGHVV